MNRGVALLWALILTTVLLIVSGSIANVIMKESRMILNIIDSSQSYANARSGADWAEDYLSDSPDLSPDIQDFEFSFTGKGKVHVKITQLTPTGKDYRIESTGYGEGSAELITRKIEKTVTPDVTRIDLMQNSNVPAPESRDVLPGTTVNNYDSFTLGFDFWKSTNTAREMTLIGLESSSDASFIGLKTGADGSVALSYKPVGSSSINIPIGIANTIETAPNGNYSYGYSAKISYIKDTSIIVRISKREAGLENEVCVRYLAQPVAGINFGNLNRIATHGSGFTPAYVYDITRDDDYIGDGGYIDFGYYYVDKLSVYGLYY